MSLNQGMIIWDVRTMTVIPNMVWIARPDEAATYFNRPWLHFTGQPLERQLGFGWTDLVHPQDVADCRAAFRQSVAWRVPFFQECRLRRHDGEYRCVAIHATPLISPDGNLLGLIGNCRDVTDRAVADGTANPFREAAEQAISLNRRLLATASHDLMQPLLTADLLARRLAHESLPNEQQDMVRCLALSLETMRGIFSDLISLATNEGDGAPPEQSCCLLGELVVNAATLFEPLAAAKRMRMSVYASRLEVVSNGAMLTRVLNNLIDNAVKYTDRGRVVVAARPAGREARLQVWDSGAGIPADRLTDIFTPFARLDSRADGLGLGLYSVRRLCSLLGHDLAVRSAPGRGTLFEIRMPQLVGPHTNAGQPYLRTNGVDEYDRL